jgi:hypothetical protein
MLKVAYKKKKKPEIDPAFLQHVKEKVFAQIVRKKKKTKPL